MDQAELDSLKSLHNQPRDHARLQSLQVNHAGDWLNVVPCPSLGLHMKQFEFRAAVLYRLGAPVYAEEGPCPACSVFSDSRGDHAISCGSQGERISRHDRLRDALFHTAVSAQLGPVKEERALLPGAEQRPADVLIPSWSGGRDTALDVTMVNPLCPTLVNRAAADPGHALATAHQRKWQKHGEACLAQGLAFIPLPVETLGGWSGPAADQIRKLGQALAWSTGQEEGVTVKHLFGRLSVLLMRGNTALLLNRVPSFPPPNVDGDL